MLALSIRQPWAWLIVRPDLTGEERAAAIRDGVTKNVENRGWHTGRRGPFLIHAARGMTRDEYEDANDPLAWIGGPTIELPPYEDLQRGGIVGQADLVDCLHFADRRSLWHFGKWGFYLANIEPLPFHPCRGQLGFFDVPWPPVSAAQEKPDE